MKCFNTTIAALLVFTLFFSSCANQKSMIDTTTVQELDIDKYLGTWYEIARFPHSFEKDLVGVTATYSMLEKGKIKVVNQGFKDSLNGPLSKSVGKAKRPDPNEPGKLKVSFFLFFYGDYYVLELDKNYEWALVGSKSPKYLWILSRKPQMDDALYTELTNKLKERGYSLDKLYKVPQKSN
jgi:apolipoprotein D and lipocalin family protein